MPAGWTYSGDPSSSQRDELRFLVQDVDEKVPLLLDLECDYLIATWYPRYGSLGMVAAAAATAISRKFAGLVSIEADGVSVDVSDLSKNYAEMAISLRYEAERAEPGGEVDISDLMTNMSPDLSIKPLVFALSMHDSLWAGQQDYGPPDSLLVFDDGGWWPY